MHVWSAQRIAFVTVAVVMSVPAAAQHVGSVSGTIRSTVSLVPISGVRIARDDGPPAAASDTGGRYSLTALPAGTVELRFTRDGYDSLSIEVDVPADGTLRLDITLAASA